ncbi:phage terminase large subunit [Sphingomonas sp.]|uniref:phage terminase large subunit n=1 Tax=Sphingomonas sp. TaxID=28214 RepID=UPI0035AE4B6A
MADEMGRRKPRVPAVLSCQRPQPSMPRRLDLDGFATLALSPLGQRPARHHRVLLRELSQVAEGGCDRLMVLMPPGSAKSTFASLIFPAWWLHRHPASSIIAASHTAELAAQFGRGVRGLAAEHAERLGYRLARDSRAAHRFETDRRGRYYATGLGGAIAGRRADLVLIDDPLRSLADAEAETQRDAAWRWYRGELVPRLRPGGRIVLVTTRMHVDDIPGRLLEQGDRWRVLCLPALGEAGDPMGRRPGEPLWPEWEPVEALARKREVVGQRAWSALYQQRPLPGGAMMFRVPQIAVLDALPDPSRLVRAWDLAATVATDGRDPDWTVGVKLGRTEAGRFVVADVVRMRGGPHDVAETIVATAQRDGHAVQVGLPQDPGQAGKQQVAWLAGRLAGFRVAASPESGAKQVRAQPLAAQIEAGNLAVLRAAWNRTLLDELAEFPLGRKDDQVDALVRAFGMLTAAGPPARRAHVPLMAR